MEETRQAAYWRANVLLISVLLAIWLGVSFGAGILLADRLDGIRVLGFPLGYGFATGGSILTFVALTFVYERIMNRLDRQHGVYER